jgi:hypothetical protein
MNDDLARLTHRIEILEASRRRFATALAVLLVVGGGLAFMTDSHAQQSDTLRTRRLVIEDAQGRDRVIVGPLDPPPSSRGLGLRINGPDGEERVGISVTDSGRAGIGLDAPPGKGDDRNRERINLAADEEGGAYIRFLDKRTWVAARLYLDDDNRVWMQFSDYSQTPNVVRRFGLPGEEVVRPQP